MALDFYHSFSFRKSNRGVAFYSEGTVMFAAGKLCVLFDLNSGVQSHFQFAERAEVSAIVRCGEVLMAGAIRGLPPSVCLFNTLSDTKKFYSAPDFMESEVFTCLSVSATLKFVAAQGGSPDWLLVIWLSQTREVLATLNPVAQGHGSVHDISFHAGGIDELVVVGNNVFRLYEYQQEAGEGKTLFQEIIFEKFEKDRVYHAIAWPEKENLAVGSSSDGKILFFRGIELVNEVSPEEDLMRGFQCWDVSDDDSKTISSIVTAPQRLLCVFAGAAVLVYEGEEIASYTLTKLVVLPLDGPASTVPGEVRERPDRLLTIVASTDGRDMVATTRDGQMLRCLDCTDGERRQQFTTLFQRQHSGPIIGIDVALGRPLIASACREVVILWNHSVGRQEMRKNFKNKIRSVAIHPTGLYLALGFDHSCRLFSVLQRDLRERNLFASKNCSQIGFSPGGQLLVVISGSSIEVYSFVTSILLSRLDGHAGLVTSFDWIGYGEKLVSCDVRGVVCEWDLSSLKKNWEVTATLSYSSVAANPSSGNLIAVGSDRSIRCFGESLLLWTLKSSKEVTCAIFAPHGKYFFVGTSDGCLEVHSYPASEETSLIHAHSGSVSGLKYDFNKDYLVSSGTDGCLFVWKNTERNGDATEGALSELCLVDTFTLTEQKERSKQLRLSLRHADTSGDCQFELSCVRHEEFLRSLALDHEQKVDDLNETIAQIKEEKQTSLFDSDSKNDNQKELDVAVRQEIIDTTVRLNDAYKTSNAYAAETERIVLKYEGEIEELSKKHAKFSSAERNTINEMMGRIRALENTLLLEREITGERSQSTREYHKRKSEQEAIERAGSLKGSQEALLAEEKSQSDRLRLEIEKLEKLTEFRALDTGRRRNVISGQVDFDVREKVDAITVSKMRHQRLEADLESKEKICRKQEKRFCDMRRSVGGFRKHHLVSDTAVDEQLEEICAKQSKIGLCRQTIEEVASSIPRLEEEIRSIEDLKLTVRERLRETVDGYRKKHKALRDTRYVISRYASMLQGCCAKECDPFKLVEDVQKLFEENCVTTGFIAETTSNADLSAEFNYQIGKLKGCYDRIKGNPSKAMRDKSMAEFRLSTENSKILRKVHDIQKDVEKLRLVISEMETALVSYQDSDHEPMRNRIEFVIEASKKNREVSAEEEMSRLDLFIEEQQREIERFQSMLAAKLEKH